MNENYLKTHFNSLESFLSPSLTEHSSIILPQGFGITKEIDIATITKDTVSAVKCPIFNALLKVDTYSSHGNQIEFSLFKKDGTLSLRKFQTYERLLLFVSFIYRNYLYSRYICQSEENNETPRIYFSLNDYKKVTLDNDGVPVQVNVKNDESIFSELGINKKTAKFFVNFLIEKGFISLHREFVYHQKCREYVVREDQFFRKPKLYTLRSQNIIVFLQKKLKTEIAEFKSLESEIDFEKHVLSEDFIKSAVFPSYDDVLEAARAIEGTKNRHGKVYTFSMPHDDSKVNFVDLNLVISRYVVTMNGPKKLHKRKVFKDVHGNDYFDRWFYTLNNIPKFIRNLITVDGEKLMELDATSLHPRLVGKLVSEFNGTEINNFFRNDVHENVSKILGVSRSEAKVVNLTYWNSRIVKGKTIGSKKNKLHFLKLDEFLKSEIPEAFETLFYIKNVMPSIKRSNRKPSNSTLYTMLVDRETRLMQRILKRYEEHGIKAIYTFDGVQVKQSDYAKASLIFNQEIDCEFGDALKIFSDY